MQVRMICVKYHDKHTRMYQKAHKLLFSSLFEHKKKKKE